MNNLIDPPAIMRPAPLWSWNDKLEVEELRRQIREIAAQGWGGFFMHPRVGYTTHYLSDAWMEAVHASIDEAQKHSISAWLYDEDRWPSGYGAGVVAELDPAYRTRALVIRPQGTEQSYDTVLQEVDISGQTYVICEQVAELGKEWFNCSAYVDLMNPDAVRAFLDAVLERYRASCGDHFGKTIPGVFTDEPLYLENSSFDALAVPWSTYLPDYFQKLKGYDIREHLPKLFLEHDDCRRIRFDFYDAASRLFCESFTKQYYEWCDRHQLKFTGHFQAEESLRLQLQWTGDVMAHYAWMHWPGVDKLERHLKHPVMIKQLSSVADQLQKERAFCEAFGISGTGVSFFHRKWIGDWLAALGINFINPHLSLYSMRGMRKRDCPPNLFFPQPWWPDEAGFSDYEARLCEAMTEGVRRVDVLLLQPLSSAWCEYSPLHWDNKYAAVEVYDGPYQEMGERLLAKQIDFHVGNEAIMAEHARVEDDRFCIGQHSYKVVVLPPALNLHRRTTELLREFLAAGGKVVLTSRLPEFVDGIATTVELPGARHATRLIEAVALVDELVSERVRALDRHTGLVAKDVFIHSRDIEDGARHLLVNTAEYREVELQIELPPAERQKAALFDLATGTASPLSLHEAARCHLTLAAAGSVLLLTGSQAEQMTQDVQTPRIVGSGGYVGSPPAGVPIEVIEQFKVELLEENVLRMDEVTLQLDGRQVYEGPVPGAWKPHFYAATNGTPFRATYQFDSDCVVNHCFAVIDSAEHLEHITFNGDAVQPLRRAGDPLLFDPARSWKDIAHTRVPLPPIRPGRNRLVIEGKKLNVSKPSGVSHQRTQPGVEPQETQLEDVLIVGRFRLQPVTEGEFRIAEFQPPTAGNITASGFPFYSGRAVYRAVANLELPPTAPCRLHLHDLRAASARVRLNNEQLATLRWPPYVVDLSGHLKAGRNEIAIELATTLNNALGPVRLAEALEQRRVGPYNFSDMSRYQKGYELMPFGLGSATLVVD